MVGVRGFAVGLTSVSHWEGSMKLLGAAGIGLGLLVVVGQLAAGVVGPWLLFGLAMAAGGVVLWRRAAPRLAAAAAPPGAGAPPDDPDEPVTVLASSDPGLVGVAKSLLEEADIPFAAINEQTQDLIGIGRVGGFNVAVGPVRIQVEGARAEEAREILRELRIEN